MKPSGIVAMSQVLLALGLSFVAQAEEKPGDHAKVEAKVSEKVTESNRDFLGVKFTLAFGAVMMSGTADEARIVGTGTDARVVVTKSSDSRAALLLESHRLIDLKARGRPRGRDASGAKVDTERVTFGLGPFLAIQSSQSEVIEGIGFGVMGGLRVGEASSFNLGIGGMLDPSAKVLAEGFRNGQPPPAGATEVLFSEEAKWGFVVLVSFAF